MRCQPHSRESPSIGSSLTIKGHISQACGSDIHSVQSFLTGTRRLILSAHSHGKMPVYRAPCICLPIHRDTTTSMTNLFFFGALKVEITSSNLTLKTETYLRKKSKTFLIFKNKGEVLNFTKNGLNYLICRSKTNQEHSGHQILYSKGKQLQAFEIRSIFTRLKNYPVSAFYNFHSIRKILNAKVPPNMTTFCLSFG